MTRGMLTAWLVVAALLSLDLTATITSRASWHRSANGPRIMTLSQLAGVLSSTVLLIILVCITVAAIKNIRRRPPRDVTRR